MNGNQNFTDVGEFHKKFDLRSVSHDGAGPGAVTRELLSFRLNFLLEELKELMEATGAHFQFDVDESVKIVMDDTSDLIDDPQAFDALLDLTYVAMGTAHLLGYPWQAGWDAVQTANMSKERAQRAEDSKRGSTFDVVKPVGWTPPNIGEILIESGWSF